MLRFAQRGQRWLRGLRTAQRASDVSFGHVDSEVKGRHAIRGFPSRHHSPRTASPLGATRLGIPTRILPAKPHNQYCLQRSSYTLPPPALLRFRSSASLSTTAARIHQHSIEDVCSSAFRLTTTSTLFTAGTASTAPFSPPTKTRLF